MKNTINWILNRRIIKPIVIARMNEDQKERYYMMQLRAHMAFFGHDISDMTDDEIKEGTNRMSKVMSSTGVTLDQAGQALKLMSQSIKTEL
jgi:hypothetical protein